VVKSSNYILLLIVAVLLFIQLRQCNGPVDDLVVVSVDSSSTLSPGRVDTVFFPVPGPIQYINIKPEKVGQQVQAKTGDTLAVFKTDFSDSLADIMVTSRVDGTLVGSDIYFKLKKPCFSVSRVDTLKTKVKKVVERNRYEFYIGGQTGGAQGLFTLQPSIMLRTKKDLVITAGYELIQKTYNIGFYTRIFKPPKLKKPF